MAGVLLSSTISGRMISRSGNVKPYIVTGSLVLTAGFLVMGTMDHDTSLLVISVGMLMVGTGVGLSMQNLVLAIQNTVPLNELGAASGAITFFRSLGGTIGVSVLGAILAGQVATGIAQGLTKAGIPASGSGGDSLDIAALPAPIRAIVQVAYGDATGHIFLVSAGIAAVGVIAALFLPPVKLRDTLDLEPAAPVTDGEPARSA
jgi:MFS family permease